MNLAGVMPHIHHFGEFLRYISAHADKPCGMFDEEAITKLMPRGFIQGMVTDAIWGRVTVVGVVFLRDEGVLRLRDYFTSVCG